jgi:hypothetical protein
MKKNKIANKIANAANKILHGESDTTQQNPENAVAELTMAERIAAAANRGRI